jgi:hypothetical protein
LASRENPTIGIVQTVESAKVDEGFLSGGVRLLGVDCEPVPKVKCDGFGIGVVLVVPPIRRRFNEGCLSRCGAIWNMRVREKREAASAITLSEEDNQTEGNEKSSRHARATKRRRSSIVGGERMEKLEMPL